MRRSFLFSFLLVFSARGLAWNSDPHPSAEGSSRFDAAPWLEDFHQLLSEMSSHYANLEWAVQGRRMDLPALRKNTEAKLREAADEGEARRIFDKFSASFGDGHLEILWPSGATSPQPAGDSPRNRCERMGYKARPHPGLDFALVPGFVPLSTPDEELFPGGILRLSNGKTFGVIRIGIFSEHAFPDVCQEAVRQLNISETAGCEAQCEDQIERESANLLTAALVRRASALRAAGATALLVDITHNGGGSNWVEAPPRALSSVPLHESSMAFVKSDHWTKQLAGRLEDVQTDLRNHAEPSAVLQQAAATLQKAINKSKQKCVMDEVWNTGKLDCSMLVADLLFASDSALAYAKPGSFPKLESRTTLFHPLRYQYEESFERPPLYVVIDHNTWSAAEYFAAVLQDNHAARIVGELTGGAGCGYTEGGIFTKLKHSGAQVKMPDCVRQRADGSNEVNGITPDLLLPWAERDSPYQRVMKLASALSAANTDKRDSH